MLSSFKAFMKFEREKDIPVFKGKNWREKAALLNQAEKRDPWILRLRVFRPFCFFSPVVMMSFLDDKHVFRDHFWMGLAALIFLMTFLDILFYGFFITPRVRKALESDIRLTA